MRPVRAERRTATVEVDRADAEAGLRTVIEELFLYYREGTAPEATIKTTTGDS